MKTIVFAYAEMGCAGITALLNAGYEISAIFTHADTSPESHAFPSVARLAAEQAFRFMRRKMLIIRCGWIASAPCSRTLSSRFIIAPC